MESPIPRNSSGRSFAVRRGWEALGDLRADWDAILASCSQGVCGPDLTLSSTWARALAATLLRDAKVFTVTVSSGGQVQAILPLYEVSAPVMSLLRREIRFITEAHAGRGGILARANDPEVIQLAFDYLLNDGPAWDVLVLTLVENSPAHKAALDALSRLGLSSRLLESNTSPYIELGDEWESVMKALPKKTRWTIRKGKRDLELLGDVDYSEISDEANVPVLLSALYEIERKSWKEESGTSITSQKQQQAFFDSLIALAARSQILSAHVLRVGGNPVAYILGLISADGVFLDLKESFDATYADHSPGHVLKEFAMERLISRGVHTYDFMGRCEPYKMRWTDKTYRSVTIAVYQPTVRGYLARLRSRLGERFRRLSARESVAE